jgi:hypothetical protein
MEQGMWVNGEIEVSVSGFFTTHHRLQAVMGSLGDLTLSAFGMGGVFHAADGRELVVERTSWWRGWHELQENGIVLGTARSGNFWRQSMDVGFRGARYELVPVGCLSRGWLLVDEAGSTLVAVEPRGAFRRGAYMRISERVPADLVVFIYYLVNVRWQEQSAAAAAVSTGAVTGS